MQVWDSNEKALDDGTIKPMIIVVGDKLDLDGEFEL